MRAAGLAFEEGAYTWRGKPVRLARLPMKLVGVLTARPGEIVRYHDLMKTVYAGRTVGDGVDKFPIALRQLAIRARDAFRLVDLEFDRIEAVRGVGLRWRA